MITRLPIAVAGLTDRGRQRGTNEDGYLCEPELGLYAVADGLGGLPHGEYASRVALQELKKEVQALPLDAEPDWQAIFTRVNGIVQGSGAARSSSYGIGTTLTAVKALPGRLVLGHVGDSGLFLFLLGGRNSRVTQDHTMAQEMLDTHGPEIAPSIPEGYHHTLTQCIGQPVTLSVQTKVLMIEPGTRCVLYTDGVTKTQEIPELSRVVADAPNPKALVHRIVDIANERGGPDNVTAVALFY